jgi:hypothetical protein
MTMIRQTFITRVPLCSGHLTDDQHGHHALPLQAPAQEAPKAAAIEAPAIITARKPRASHGKNAPDLTRRSCSAGPMPPTRCGASWCAACARNDAAPAAPMAELRHRPAAHLPLHRDPPPGSVPKSPPHAGTLTARTLRQILARLRHDGCGGLAAKAELLVANRDHRNLGARSSRVPAQINRD